MQRRILSIYRWLVVMCLGLSACSQVSTDDQRLTIATAANMQFAMKELSQSFTEKTGIACDLVIGSSGKLTAQIKEGAPFDLFVSANLRYPQEVYRSGLAQDSPKVYAYGQLVLWTNSRNHERPSLEVLSQESVRHIALANPKTAPYGLAATEVLTHHGLLDSLQAKLVYGESIAQTNQFILSGAAEMGFTAMSVVLSANMKEKGHWMAIDPDIYRPIEQGIVLLKRAAANEDAQAFYEFLFTEQGQAILQRYGYQTNRAGSMIQP